MGFNPQKKLELLQQSYRYMITAREMDLLEQSYTARGEAFFHVSGAGHEGTCVLNHFFNNNDWLHCHYRDKALMLARGISPSMFFMSLFNKAGSHSKGRQMNAHMSAPDLNILSLVGPVGNSALHATGVASTVKDDAGNPVVLCALGDGMTQESEVIEAIGQAVRDELPVLFFIQDNSFAISTTTNGQTFYSRPDGDPDTFYGVKIHRVDGRFPQQSFDSLADIVETMRKDRGPQIVVYSVDRLHNHTNADDQRVYRSAEEIEGVAQTGDPIKNLRSWLIENGIDAAELDAKTAGIVEDLKKAARDAQLSPEPEACFDAKKELPAKLLDKTNEYRGKTSSELDESESLVMLEALREVLDFRLSSDDRVSLYGEDIADPKGDVFGVTRGLSLKYPGRVRNSPLSESLILGHSIGQALAGKRPVAFLQFGDFLPIAYNQIFAELGSMFWRTDGGWQAPVIVMITTGGYKPGLGPFHASSMETLAAHTPGVDVFMPSTAGDAAGMLNAAFESGRPTLFFYPKSCLNDREAATSKDVSKQLVVPGSARFDRTGSDITFVTYGNPVRLCKTACDVLEKEKISADLIDLRSIVPWDQEAVVASAEKTGRVVIIHEDNHTAGFGAEIAATITEKARRRVKIARVTKSDTYVPCNFANQLEVLPSYKRILETAVDLLGGSVFWKKDEKTEAGVFTVEAAGSSPSDEQVTVLEWKIKKGDHVTSGDLVAEMEADKAAFEMKSPVDGHVELLLVEEGNTVKVGTPLFSVKTGGNESAGVIKPITRENPGEPVIENIDLGSLRAVASPGAASTGGRAVSGKAGIIAISVAAGSRIVDNVEIEAMGSGWTPEDIVKRTGIERRHWVAEGEDALSLAVKASREVLAKAELSIEDIGGIICTTGTPLMTTPAMATLIHFELAGAKEGTDMMAYDMSAACSGFLYALQAASDYFVASPEKPLLIVTTETLSKKLDVQDKSTAPIFGDAATATIVAAPGYKKTPWALIHRPIIGAMGEDGKTLSVPCGIDETVAMDGPTVYLEAVKNMMLYLNKACAASDLLTEDLDLIVPHQANQRIINAIRQRLKLDEKKVYSNIAEYGNTSSSTIPICLDEIMKAGTTGGKYLGLAAFGGGFTFAGGILEIV